MKIETYKEKYHQQTKGFITKILDEEFHLSDLKNLLKDLDDIEGHYRKNGGNFWIVTHNNKLIGTIGFLNYGKRRGYIKRMYVDKNFRRQKLGENLLHTVLNYARENSYKEIYVGTRKHMLEANNFYVKNNFQQIEKMPEDIPDFGDPMLYKYFL